MGKSKRHRIRKAKENEAEDSSDDAQGLLYFIFHHHRKCCNFNFAKLIEELEHVCSFPNFGFY